MYNIFYIFKNKIFFIFYYSYNKKIYNNTYHNYIEIDIMKHINNYKECEKKY